MFDIANIFLFFSHLLKNAFSLKNIYFGKVCRVCRPFWQTFFKNVKLKNIFFRSFSQKGRHTRHTKLFSKKRLGKSNSCDFAKCANPLGTLCQDPAHFAKAY